MPDLRLGKPNFRPERFERPNLRLERGDLKPGRPGLRPERPDLRPGRSDLRLDLRSISLMRSFVLQDFVLFAATAQKRVAV